MVLLLAAGCRDKNSAPMRLVDGSPTTRPPVALETVSRPAVETTYRTVPAARIGGSARAAACIHGPARGIRPSGLVVERVGADGETVTIRNAAGVVACDGTRSGSTRWCGSSSGRLYGGELRDPRLDLGGCKAHGTVSLAFAWIEPDPGAKYIAVEEDGYAEVYEPAAGLPVRVSTRDLSDGSGATFHVSEHDAQGDLIRRFELETVPAG